MQAVTAAQMRDMDRATMEALGVPGYELMDRAGRGLAQVIRRICALRDMRRPVIRLFAGKGNNGGDVFAAARHLAPDGADLEVLLVGPPEQLQGEARLHFDAMDDRVCVQVLADAQACNAWVCPGQVDIVVDGLLGTGAKGAPREPAASAIRALQRVGARATVVAVDMPSGVQADTGEAAEPAVVADVTVTMAYPKVGLLQPASLPYTGSVVVQDIGIPGSLLPASRQDAVHVWTQQETAEALPRRARCSHKGDYGRVLIVGGAPGFMGAVSMAARAALLSGAGLVEALVPASIVHDVAVLLPEVMVHAGETHAQGGLRADALDAIGTKLEGYDAILVGPGMTCHPDGAAVLKGLAALQQPVLVIDADALTLLAQMDDWQQGRSAPTILTPHPGEAGRLVGQDTQQLQVHRPAAAQDLAKRYGAVAILKGAGTLIADGDRMVMNLTGNPGMATGGSGDVLGGLVGGLAAQGLDAFDAAASGVYLHGVAGDRAAWHGSQAGLTAMQLLAQLPATFRETLGR